MTVLQLKALLDKYPDACEVNLIDAENHTRQFDIYFTQRIPMGLVIGLGEKSEPNLEISL